MSLTSNIKNKTKIGTFLLDLVVVPTFKELPKNPIIKHRYRRWSLIGTAFDYLVRMIISEQKKIDFEPKIAELAIKYYLEQQDIDNCQEPINMDSRKLSSDLTEANISDTCKCNICLTKRGFNQSKIGALESISRNDLFSMAKYSLQFARLDVYVRARFWDTNWQSYESDDDDATELVDLVELWKESFEIPDGDLDLNPVMPFSRLVGGADADIVSGRNIIDWKVVNDPRRDLTKNIAQMIGYALLLNLEEVKITTCHLYFARHGYHYIANFEDLMNTSMPEALKQFKKLTSFDRNSEITKLIPAKVSSNSNSYNAYWARRIENQCIGKTKDGRRCTQVSKKGQETCYHHDTKNNKQCSGQTQTGERCIYPVKKGQKYCHIHAPLVIQTLNPNEDNLLQEKMKQIQPVPANFWRKIRYGTTKYPTKKSWVSWCRKFSKQHPMWNQKNSYWGSQNEIVLKLMKICNIEKTSVISFLDSRKVDLTLVKSNWDRFWKVHELIIQEQKNNPENTNL